MSMKNALIICFLVGLTFGCASGKEVKEQEVKKTETQAVQKKEITEVSSSDFKRAIQTAVKNMVQSGVLNKSGGDRYVVTVSYIVDTTQKKFDTALIKQDLSTVLASGRKVRVVSTSSKTIVPQIIVTGRIIQRTARVRGGKKRQEYYLHLVLTEAKSGMKLWENITPVVKKGN